ncbi:MAG: branched-chain amino acid aminotransferase [SAR324 cluster bacterium]|nr:branched-chain amino acid aminotransferase [SAR324 cluster bacterium]
MEIKITPVAPEERQIPPEDISNIVFGSQFTNHMFLMEWDKNVGWHDARIEKYHSLTLEPSAIIFHYGQEAFEGLKAYCTVDGKYVLFRPEQNFARFNKTARRMCLPELDQAFALRALKRLLEQDIEWIPKAEGTSLYIRPTIIATEPALGLKQSASFLFFIILCPVGPYYSEGFNPVKIIVSEEYTRAAPGGVGEAKTAGNYAASNLAEKKAKEHGFTQVLWLDAVERRYVEEVGSMNIFFVIDDEIITPQLTGTILPGITRDSVLQVGKHWGLTMTERRISIEEVMEAVENGALTEIFGSGTAAVISPVGELHYHGKKYIIKDGKTGPCARRFFDEIVGIQYGKVEDPFRWLEPVLSA